MVCLFCAECDAKIGAIFVQYDRDELMEMLQEASIACAALNDVADLVSHSQLQTVSYLTSTGEQAEVVAPAVTFLGADPTYGDIPACGADSDKIRSEF